MLDAGIQKEKEPESSKIGGNMVNILRNPPFIHRF
jgi:hypothetical protein